MARQFLASGSGREQPLDSEAAPKATVKARTTVIADQTRADAGHPTTATSIHLHLCILHRCPRLGRLTLLTTATWRVDSCQRASRGRFTFRCSFVVGTQCVAL